MSVPQNVVQFSSRFAFEFRFNLKPLLRAVRSTLGPTSAQSCAFNECGHRLLLYLSVSTADPPRADSPLEFKQFKQPGRPGKWGHFFRTEGCRACPSLMASVGRVGPVGRVSSDGRGRVLLICAQQKPLVVTGGTREMPGQRGQNLRLAKRPQLPGEEELSWTGTKPEHSPRSAILVAVSLLHRCSVFAQLAVNSH